MKNSNAKSKFITRVMILILLLTSAMSYIGCGLFEETPIILDNEIPDLNNQNISYLLLRDLNVSEDITDVEHYYYSIDGGFVIKDGEILYDPAIIEVSAEFDGEGLNKNSFSIYLIKESSMSVMGMFYPVKGNIGELEYEFKYVDASPYKFHKVVYIYSNSQLIGKVYYDTSKIVQNDWITEFLNNNLILMNVKQYSVEESNGAENRQNHIVSYLNIGNIVSSEYCNEVINYSSNVNGGMNIEFGSNCYSDIKNTVNIEFNGNESTNYADISMQAEFYEFKEALGVLDYKIVDDLKDNASTVSIYNGDVIVGEINIICDNEITHEWIEGFLNENLIVTEIKNR